MSYRLRMRTYLARPWGGFAELGLAVALYALYEVVRGFGSTSEVLARAHTEQIVALERHLHVYGERSVQAAVEHVPALPGVLGFLYMTLHLVGTTLALIWVYRYHRQWFPLIRTTIVTATAIALVIYVLYPAAPPRLAGLGFADTVTSAAHVNLSSEALGSLYNPFAAVPSLHFGYALLVGVAMFVLAQNRVVRAIGALYPAIMLFVIVATGNHFVFDAAAGGVVMVVAWWIALRLSPAGLLDRRTPALRAA
jgi:PAP2 superfamily